MASQPHWYDIGKHTYEWTVFGHWIDAWARTARDNQLPDLMWQRELEAQGEVAARHAKDPTAPKPIQHPDEWSEAGFMAGRGFGKTRVGAQWLGYEAIMDPECLPSFVVAPTYADVQKVCFEGPAGLLTTLPKALVSNYNSTDLIITLFTGAKIFGFTAEKPDRLRGPQSARAWCDEIAAWGPGGKDVLDMLLMGLRMGEYTKLLWTTTPRPTEFIRELSKPAPGRVIVRGTTYENKANLSKTFFKQLEQYEGTTLGRQELDGELIDPEEAGIIRRSWFRLWPHDKLLPELDWIIMSLDTAFTEYTHDKKTNTADPTACTVWGSFKVKNEHHLILLDSWHDHLGMPELIKRVKKEMKETYGDEQDRALIRPLTGSSKPITSGRTVDLLVIEDKGSGISLRQMLENDNIEAYAYNPGNADKLSRLHMVSHIFARKRIWLPESENHKGRPKTWVEPMLAQLCAFTGAGSTKHDDYVDSCTQAIRLCIDKGLVTALREPKPEEVLAKQHALGKPLINPYAQ